MRNIRIYQIRGCEKWSKDFFIFHSFSLILEHINKLSQTLDPRQFAPLQPGRVFCMQLGLGFGNQDIRFFIKRTCHAVGKYLKLAQKEFWDTPSVLACHLTGISINFTPRRNGFKAVSRKKDASILPSG